MSNNDQWFEPGDKVMRVQEADKLGLRWHQRHGPETDYGIVLCVQSCEFHHPLGKNAVRFTGVENFYYACCFRQVEEIRLCLNAVKKTEQPTTIPA